MIMSTYDLSTAIRNRMDLKVFLLVDKLGRVRTTRDWVLPNLTGVWLEQQGDASDATQWRVEYDEDGNELTIDLTSDEE